MLLLKSLPPALRQNRFLSTCYGNPPLRDLSHGRLSVSGRALLRLWLLHEPLLSDRLLCVSRLHFQRVISGKEEAATNLSGKGRWREDSGL